MEHVEKMESEAKVFGFWLYLMTDLVIFAVLFAAFIVLRHSTYGGPSGRELFELPLALTETIILLTSSFTCSLAMIATHERKKVPATIWFGLTFVLGVAFLFIEIYEFSKFAHEGASWDRSAFLSSYFTLVGTHGLHISVGLLWLIVAVCQLWIQPFEHSLSRIFRMALFWHFLDVVWIFIFTVVYGIGYLS